MKILIVIPAYNEEKLIGQTLNTLTDFIKNTLTGHCLIVVADNNSTDQTAQIVKQISSQNQQVEYFFVPKKGKGIAIRKAWQHYQDGFDVFIFMDADLATDLQSLPNLVAEIKNGNDLVLGSRYIKGSVVKKSWLRHFFSLGYRLVLKLLLRTKTKDMPCGFKAVNKQVVKDILPRISNNTWFFDTELVYLAEKDNLKIKEIPVKWQEPRSDDNKSRVNIFKVSWLYLKEAWKLRSRKE